MNIADSKVYTPYIEAHRCVLYGYDASEEMPCNDFLLQNFIGKPLPDGWKLPKYIAEYTKFPLNDFVRGHTEAPFVSERAKKALTPILGDEAEFRSIGKILDEDYYVMNVINVVDCLDEKKSNIVRGDDGRVMALLDAVFLPNRIPDSKVFKVPQNTTRIYATYRFVDIVRKHQLTGIGFELADNVKFGLKKSIFPNLPLRVGKFKKNRIK
jgi:hypothetical protein